MASNGLLTLFVLRYIFQRFLICITKINNYWNHFRVSLESDSFCSNKISDFFIDKFSLNLIMNINNNINKFGCCNVSLFTEAASPPQWWVIIRTGVALLRNVLIFWSISLKIASLKFSRSKWVSPYRRHKVYKDDFDKKKFFFSKIFQVKNQIWGKYVNCVFWPKEATKIYC